MLGQPITSFQPGLGSLALKGLPILTDAGDYDGVHLAVKSLACDLGKVTGQKPEIWTTITGRPHVNGLIVVGSLPRCRFLSDVRAANQATDPASTSIEGMWETFETSICSSSWPVADRVFVVAGSDKRGTIFGTYTLSEQIGVSPWHWWADVAVQPREEVYALPVAVRQGEPSVQYRGIFINDEAPALRDWARDEFGPQFNSAFYTKVFELLLRLKVTMWSGYPEPGSSFFTGDPANQALADRYGIVISTSHHEPMQRSMTEWHVSSKGTGARWRWDAQNKPALVQHFKGGITRAKPYESVITLGMRGDTDYVTLLFADDNFGNIRRLPTPAEKQRRGGCGAYDNGITKLWVINVGDIKPLEVPLTFALSLAWDINSITPSSIPTFFDTFAAHTFGPEYSSDIGRLLATHDRLLALRRLEHIEPETFSVLHYNEAVSIMQRLQGEEQFSSVVLDSLPEHHKAAFFQLVHYPVRAARVFVDLQVSLAKNQLYGEQRRNTTNTMAMRVLELFDLDHNLTQQYHHSPWTGDKWNHIMKQPRYGFGTDGGDYHTPTRNLVRGLSFVQRRQDSTPIAGQMGIAVEGHAGILPGLANEECCRMQPSRASRAAGLQLSALSSYGRSSCYFDVYCRGTRPVSWSLHAPSSDEEWLCISPRTGTLDPDATEDQRVVLTIPDWGRVPTGLCTVIDIGIRSADGDYEEVHLPVDNRRAPMSFSGFVESDGCVSIAVGDVPISTSQPTFYEHLPYLGRLPSDSISLASPLAQPDSITTTTTTTTTATPPYLTYPMFTLTAASSATVTLYFTMALNAHADGRPFAYDVAVDDSVLHGVPLAGRSHPSDLPEGCLGPPAYRPVEGRSVMRL
ncbi:hypothetical protein SCUCBS95973_006416 [Sporothrix curviconia]|uniref:Gylcosyl hydrolase 115 C-terminal domain-containing protein n=1 Tax=Sporothrix curviconia TaxID=1260050 RepID=A0ABP0C5X9_9PEZI